LYSHSKVKLEQYHLFFIHICINLTYLEFILNLLIDLIEE